MKPILQSSSVLSSKPEMSQVIRGVKRSQLLIGGHFHTSPFHLLCKKTFGVEHRCLDGRHKRRSGRSCVSLPQHCPSSPRLSSSPSPTVCGVLLKDNELSSPLPKIVGILLFPAMWPAGRQSLQSGGANQKEFKHLPPPYYVVLNRVHAEEEAKQGGQSHGKQ